MKIKNFGELAISDSRRIALAAAEAGLLAIDTREVIKSSVRLEGERLMLDAEEINTKNISRLYVVGVGKCALAAGEELEEILGERISDGIILDVRPGKLRRLRYFQGDHPMPTERNINYTKEIISLLSRTKEDDLVLFIISGGGSTLLCLPNKFTCVEEASLVKALFTAGADIYELNTLRKHLSAARGGWLARHAYPARVVSLIFSDVPGDELSFVASGPTVRDQTSWADAQAVFAKYHLAEHCGFSAADLLETPKEEKYFARVTNRLVVSNVLALKAMSRALEKKGYQTKICETRLQGEARAVGERLVKRLHRAGSKKALLYGGETTVTVRGPGQGGRNQELVLSALSLTGEKELVLSLASDGRDNSEAAGAIADGETRKKAAALGLSTNDFLSRNDSLNFFSRTQDAILTGPTGSNVSDLILTLRG